MDLKEKFIGIVKEIFPNKKILVVGDLMVDEYVLGKVSRISPEAPVVVLNYTQRKREAGGAGNVAKNIKEFSKSVSIAGIVADDAEGTWIKKNLSESGIEIAGIFSESDRPTTVKTRFATIGHQLLRVDNEKSNCIKQESKENIFAYIQKNILECDAIILSDYRKGIFNDGTFIKQIISLCIEHGVLVVADSKRQDIEIFADIDFIKPNNIELEEATGIKIYNDESLDEAGFTYLKKSKAKNLVVTRGDKGISIFTDGKKRRDYASKALQVFDVTGAGDTVISILALGVCSGLSLDESAQLANLAASVVIGKAGTSAVTANELLRRIIED